MSAVAPFWTVKSSSIIADIVGKENGIGMDTNMIRHDEFLADQSHSTHGQAGCYIQGIVGIGQNNLELRTGTGKVLCLVLGPFNLGVSLQDTSRVALRTIHRVGTTRLED